MSRFFDDEAEEDEDEDDDENEMRNQQEEVLGEDERQAIELVEARHAKNRARLNTDANELARQYEEQAAMQATLEKKNKFSMESGLPGGPRGSSITHQALLPSINDPSIWRLKVASGMEQALVLAVMRKAIASRENGGPLRIKSVFCSGSRGYIYIEAIAEPLARDAINGLRGIFQSSLQKIPVREMTSVVTISKVKKPLVEGQWVRLSRGVLKGDLARIVEIIEGGSRIVIQAVPRPDYAAGTGSSRGGVKTSSNMRPPKRLFDPVEAKTAGASVIRRPFPTSRHGEKYDFWDNDFYKDGFLYKEVNPVTFIKSENVKPLMEETKYFVAKKKGRKDEVYDDGYDEPEEEQDEEDDDDDDVDENGKSKKKSSYITDIADQLTGLDEVANEKTVPYSVGDLVQVVAGELKNLVAKIINLNSVTKTVQVIPHNTALSGEFTIEMNVLSKYVQPGEHVKVINGQYRGQTGRVVSLVQRDGKSMAAILTDGVNTEILCDIGYLQISQEVTAGLGNLMGYELYDLVILSDNETAVIIAVGAEKLRVINNQGVVKEVFPQELHGKHNTRSQSQTAIDSQQVQVKVGDIVNIIAGTHAKQSGTVKHILKGCMWVHSNMYLKDSGVFVARGRLCVAVGKNAITGTTGTRPAIQQQQQRRGGRDESIGKTVRIIKGEYKGMLAQVVDSVNDSYQVELLAKMKKINIPKAKTVMVGDKEGSLTSDTRNSTLYANGIQNTPYYSQQTPYLSGSATPHPGNETPNMGGMTPGRTPNPYASDRDDDPSVWTVGANATAGGVSGGSQSGAASSQGYSGSRSPGHSLNRSGNLYDSSPWMMSDSSVHSSQRGPSLPSTSPYSPYSGAGSSSYTPSTACDTPLVSSGGQADPDWVVNMVVKFTSGTFANKNAVVLGIPQNGQVLVQFRHDRGDLIGSPLTVNVNDLTNAAPPTGEKVLVIGGKHKGLTGLSKVSFIYVFILQIV